MKKSLVETTKEKKRRRKTKGKESSLVHHIQTIYAISITIAIPPIHQFMLTHSQKRNQ
jgi:hypothetical protein